MVLTPGAMTWIGWFASQGRQTSAGTNPTLTGFMMTMPTSCFRQAGMSTSKASRRTTLSGNSTTSISPVSTPRARAVKSLWPASAQVADLALPARFQQPLDRPAGREMGVDHLLGVGAQVVDVQVLAVQLLQVFVNALQNLVAGSAGGLAARR